ncbi:deleted in malignant brain tumors 1 protein-like isoform X2 [Halichondria panicea]|uniref:deleted in malignant brain tumors 1 protein-like isoform X2 n=1 Tax=Halichondria panicea TaxID=6063 RepID=UPI00312B3A68
MKLLLVLALSFIVSTHQQDPIQGDCEHDGDLRLVNRIRDNFGALQVCESEFGWRYVTPLHWTLAAARLAYAVLGSLTLSNELRHIRKLRDANCVENAHALYDCIVSEERKETVVTINCVDCNDGAMRLVGGSTVSEGRLEICHNGQWGTICNQGWTHRRAAQVCSRLGLPTYYATLHQFNEGAASVHTYNCTTMDSDISNCIQEFSCTHSMDVGVKCLPFTDASTETSQPSYGATTESSITQSTVMSTSGTLGALVGLLAAALVVVVTGWIVSCVYFQRKISKKCKDHTHTTSASTSDPTLQLKNPAYGVSITVPHTTYSSHGPSYEVIDTNEGAGHSYDAISHRGAARPHPPTTPHVSNEEYSMLDTSRENTLESNTGDGQYSMVRHTDPQDYEVPAPLRGKSTLH